MSADAKLKAYIDRILRCREAEDEAKQDTKDVYAELAAEGYEKAIVGQVVTFLRKREKDGDKLSEQSAKFDLYLDAYERPSHVHAREDGEVNAKLIATVATGMQTETGRKALVTALDIMIEREEAEEQASDGSPSVSSSLTTREAEESVVSNPEMDRATEGSFETGSEAAEKGREAIPAGPEGVDLNHAGAGESPAILPEQTAEQAGGEHEVATGSALRAGLAAPTSNTGEGAANSALPDSGVVMEYVPPTGMKRLPFAHCFPELSKAEYERLEKDIAANRVREPIIRQGDVIVDGWARYNISRAYGMSYPVREYHGDDVLLDVIEWQRASRNFTPAQERKIAAELAKEIPHRADDIMVAFGLAEALEVA